MMHASRSLVLLALLPISSGGGAAQEVDLGLHAGQVSDETGGVHAGATISPGLSWAGSAGHARVGLTGTLLNGGSMIGGAVVDGEASLWRAGPLALVLGVTGSASASDRGYRAASAAAAPAVRLGGSGFTAQIGPLLRAGGEGQPEHRPAGGLLPLPASSTGGGVVWRQAQGMAATMTADRGILNAAIGWTRLQTDPGVAWTDWSATAGLELGGVEAGAILGRRNGAVEGSWGSVFAAVPLASKVAAIAAAGRQAADPLTGRASGRFATVGLRVTAGHSTPRPEPVAPTTGPTGDRMVVLRAERDARVELVADWTGWQPVAVPEADRGTYPVEVQLAPGTYRFAFLVNGRWTVPPGYPTEPDEYGGRRAVLRVAG